MRETGLIAEALEHHRRQMQRAEEEERRHRIQAVERLAAMSLPVSAWEQMEREIAEARQEVYKQCSDVPL
jgi:hypothetical protein